jgi:xylono-1,5-lactonase
MRLPYPELAPIRTPLYPGCMETCCHGYGLVEAPRADATGACVFSDVLRGGLHRWTPDGAVTTLVPKRRGIGGHVPHADGGVVVSGRDVAHVREGATRVLLAPPAGVLGFNDLTTDAAGRVYVGSLRSPAFEDAGPRTPGETYRIDADGSVTVLYDDVAFANGIGFSPDGTVLYQSNYSEGHVLAHDVAEGRGERRRVFARLTEGNPDGLAVDELGCVWVASGSAGGLARFTPAGALDSFLAVPAPFVASCCFGGPDRRDLFIATMGNTEDASRGGTLFRTRVQVPGLVAQPSRV